MKKFKNVLRSSTTIYPLVIIICIPLLLIANTVWNLKSFNRDANFIVRHQAISIAETSTPFLVSTLEDKSQTKKLLESIVENTADVKAVTVIKNSQGELILHSTTDENFDKDNLGPEGLNQLSISLNKSFAGLVYDPFEQENVWYVSVPLQTDDGDFVILMKVSTSSVNQILSRTSSDSFAILAILIIVTLILLMNHFFFYKKSLHAKHLEEVDKLKDEFFSMAAHELRTPVTALVGYIEMITDKLKSSAGNNINDELITIKSITNNLNELINNLLEISRIEQGRLKIVPSEIKIEEIILQVIKTLNPIAQNKNIVIKYSGDKLPTIFSDNQRVQEILTNLIGNSVKYTEKGAITVTSAIKGDFIEIRVKDTGIGIPADKLSKLFNKFERVKDAKTKNVQGTGLGLWITKRLVERLGGEISAESIYGEGSAFTFTIPIVKKDNQ